MWPDWEGILDFDYANCTNDRHKKRQLYEDYVCARCEVVCAAEGVRKSAKELMHINGGSFGSQRRTAPPAPQLSGPAGPNLLHDIVIVLGYRSSPQTAGR